MLLFLFLFIDLYFSIPAVIAQIFNPIAELVTPIGTPTKEAKAEMETHPLTVYNKCVINITQNSANFFMLFN